MKLTQILSNGRRTFKFYRDGYKYLVKISGDMSYQFESMFKYCAMLTNDLLNNGFDYVGGRSIYSTKD